MSLAVEQLQDLTNAGIPLSPELALEHWSFAVRAAALTAVDPIATGGVLVSARFGPVRQAWLGVLADLLGPHRRLVKVPNHITDDRLLGGLDLSATLASGRLVERSGLLVAADGDVIVLPSVERAPKALLAQIAMVRDRGMVMHGSGNDAQSRQSAFGLIALDEGLGDDETVSPILSDRLGMRSDLEGLRFGDLESFECWNRETVAQARDRLADVETPTAAAETLCRVAAAFGIASLRAPLYALAVARCNAALEARSRIDEEDLAVAVRLALLWRASQIPDFSEAEHDEPDDQHEPSDTPELPEDDETRNEDALPAEVDQLIERLVETVTARLPTDLLDRLLTTRRAYRTGSSPQARSGNEIRSKTGRASAGVRRGDPRNGQRLALYPTLLASAPLQKLRARETRPTQGPGAGTAPRLQIRADDFRIYRKRTYQETLTIFAVDASGSAALARLGEAKGAVELLLNDCYVRRDQVALIAFRGTAAEVVLPPTSALARAKRCLSILAGGGGTPLAAGLTKASLLAAAARHRGQNVALVFLTDGKANIAADGSPGRDRATQDAYEAARRIRAAGFPALLVDTSQFADERVAQLAETMAAHYLALPRLDAVGIKHAAAALAGKAG